MAGLGNLFQKAVYLGVGLAAYAGDKVSQNIGELNIEELRLQAQALAAELVQRGEMTTEEARRMVDDLVNRAQATTVEGHPVSDSSGDQTQAAPRTIEIDFEEDGSGTAAKPSSPMAAAEQQQADALRQQVADLQAQLEQLRRS